MSRIDAYHKAQSATVLVTPRQTEAEALMRIARDLEVAQPDITPALMDALVRNAQLWRVFAEDCSNEGNQLPKELRVQIVNLAVWVIKQCDQAMSGAVTVDAMIEINRMVARGLLTSGAAAEAPAQRGETSGVA